MAEHGWRKPAPLRRRTPAEDFILAKYSGYLMGTSIGTEEISLELEAAVPEDGALLKMQISANRLPSVPVETAGE